MTWTHATDQPWQPEAGWEYCTMEWIWDRNQMTVYYADREAETSHGSYAEVVQRLNALGREQWEVSTCAAAGNWLFWTLKRPRA